MDVNISAEGDTKGSFIIGLLCGINEVIKTRHLEYWLAHGQLFSKIISLKLFQNSLQIVAMLPSFP